jgi:hypothetical protein
MLTAARNCREVGGRGATGNAPAGRGGRDNVDHPPAVIMTSRTQPAKRSLGPGRESAAGRAWNAENYGFVEVKREIGGLFNHQEWNIYSNPRVVTTERLGKTFPKRGTKPPTRSKV